MDLASAAKSLVLSPRKTKEKALNVDTITSDGELNTKNINESDMFLYGGKHKSSVNRIIKSSERGEVTANNTRKSSFERNNEKSEGEIDNPGEVILDEKFEEVVASKSSKLNSFNKNKNSSGASKAKLDKTVIDLNISPAKNSINNIKIESLCN